jgi:hypothetical protein
LTEAQLRRSSLRAPAKGVRASGDAPGPGDLARRCREVRPSLPDDAVFCHVTALGLLHVDRPLGLDPGGPLHVQVGPVSTPPRGSGIVGHRRAAVDVRRVLLPGRVAVLAPDLVWVQLAARLSPTELVVLGDALTRRRNPVTGLDRLREAVADLPPGARGRRRAAAALDQVRPGTDSPMETRLRLLLVEAGLPCPLVNAPIRSGSGHFVALPDLSYPRERVAIEYDGDLHRTDRRTWRRDIARRQAMEAQGWRVITCTADDVLRHPDRPVAWVRQALASRVRAMWGSAL